MNIASVELLGHAKPETTGPLRGGAGRVSGGRRGRCGAHFLSGRSGCDSGVAFLRPSCISVHGRILLLLSAGSRRSRWRGWWLHCDCRLGLLAITRRTLVRHVGRVFVACRGSVSSREAAPQGHR